MRTSILALAIGAALLSAGAVRAQSYDLVIEHGRVMDPETGADRIANVGVKGGVIRAISSKRLTGRRVIDAKGLVVAPGFIDLHSHAQYPLGYDLQAQDGVTTSLELEAGVYPLAPFYASREGHTRINYGASVGYLGVRVKVVTGLDGGALDNGPALARKAEWAEKPLNDAQQTEARDMVAEQFRAGGLGVGMLYEYLPGVTRAELFHVFETAGTLHAPLFIHARASADTSTNAILDTMQEVVADSAATGAPAHLCHIGSKTKSSAGVVLQMFAGARARGVDVTTEVYPYSAGSTVIGSALFNEGFREHLGIDYGDLEWPLTGERLTAESFARYRRDNPTGWIIIHSIPEATVDLAIAEPSVMIASDAVPFINGSGHPRGSGTFARVLGLYVRQKHTTSLMTALSKMTLQPARRLEAIAPVMRRKGRVQVGADADLTLFDPDKVIDRGTYRDPVRPSAGIPYVIVGGAPVVDKGAVVADAFPGRGVKSAPR